MNKFYDYLIVFLVSMVPVIELRGAVPIGVGLGLNFMEALPLAIVGNMLPVPFILIFIRKILNWMKGTKHFSKFANWLQEKSDKNAPKIQKYAVFGLYLFVAIPLPGTGAWTGSLVAALLGMDFKKSFFSIFLGVITAGLIMAAISYGFLGFLSFLL